MPEFEQCRPLSDGSSVDVVEYVKSDGTPKKRKMRVSGNCNLCDVSLPERETLESKYNIENPTTRADYVEYQRKVEAEPYGQRWVQSPQKDPFNKDINFNWSTRYFAAVVNMLFPNSPYEEIIDPETGLSKRTYKFEFHLRQLYYRINSRQICIPKVSKASKIKGTQIRALNGELIAPTYDDNTYKRINELLDNARYSGLIDYQQIRDRKVVHDIQPSPLYFKKRAKTLTYKPSPKVRIDFEPFHITLDMPIIVIITEKFEFDHIFEKLANKYFIFYYSLEGQMSITNAKKVYDFIKSTSRIGIVLAVSDHDPSGASFGTAIYRKLQYFTAQDKDKDKPTIIVKDWLIGEQELTEIRQLELETGKRVFRTRTEHQYYPSVEIVELDALDDLIGYGEYRNCTTLAEVFDVKLQKMFFPTADLRPMLNVYGNTISANVALVPKSLIEEETQTFREKFEKDMKETLMQLDERIATSDEQTAASLRQLKEMVDRAQQEFKGVFKSNYNIGEYVDTKQYAEELRKGIENLDSVKLIERLAEEVKGQVPIFYSTPDPPSDIGSDEWWSQTNLDRWKAYESGRAAGKSPEDILLESRYSLSPADLPPVNINAPYGEVTDKLKELKGKKRAFGETISGAELQARKRARLAIAEAKKGQEDAIRELTEQEIGEIVKKIAPAQKKRKPEEEEEE